MRGRYVKSSLFGLIIVILGLALAGSASAKEVHLLTSRFGAGELSLTEQSGVAVNQDTGDVYVADTGDERIVKYGPDGESLGTPIAATEPTFLALDNSSGGSNGDIYVVEQDEEVIAKIDSSGAPVVTWGTAGRMGGLGKIAGIAVDQAGNLFVMTAKGVLHELNASGSETSGCDLVELGVVRGEGGVRPNGIAVDGDDGVYYIVGSLSQKETRKITSPPNCKFLKGKEGEGGSYGLFGQANGVTVDEADDSTWRTQQEGDALTHFASSGGGPLEYTGQSEGLKHGGQLAVRSEDEKIYVADVGHNDIAVYTPVNVEPPQVTIDPPSEVTGTTAHFRAEINPGAPANNPPPWDVAYRFQCIPKCPGVNGNLAAGSETKTVEGTVANLLPGTEYLVYVTAENAGGIARAPEEPEEGLPFQTLVIPPSISDEFVTEATESTATLAASINPGGTEAGYRVQYVTRSQFEASGFAEAGETGEQSLAGAEAAPVSVTVSGLSASTPYVTRFVATNTVEGTLETVFGEPISFATREPSLIGPCANEVFRTGAGSLLPDCRAYEQSTPVNKNGGGPAALPGMVQAAEDPDGITFYSQAGIPGGFGAQDYPSFLSSRGEGSWGTQGLLPPAALGPQGEYLGLTPGGRYAITEATEFDASSESIQTGLFERDLRSGEITTIVPYEPGCKESICFNLAGASVDGSRVFIETEVPLTGQTPSGQPNLFVWERESGDIALVDVDESGQPLPEGGFAGPYFWPKNEFASGTLNGGTRTHLYVGPLNVISRDGSEVVYTERGEGEDRGQLYVRVGLGGPSPKSLKVSAYREGREGPEFPAAFLEATPDGRYVFFKSRAELTSDSYAGEGTESLYRYDVSSESLVNLTSEKKTKFAAGPGVQGMLGASESGAVAYFVATTALTTQPGPGGKTAESGKPNLYRWEAGAKQPLSFITTLQGLRLSAVESDAANWSPAPESGNGGQYPKTARVSADGGAVVFASYRALTGAQNQAKQCGRGELGPCNEFFRYSAATGALDCISCNPTGAQPLGSATIGSPFIDAEDLPTVYPSPVLSRNLSADGDRFFFQTPDALVAGDVNARSGCRFEPEEKSTCMDVYEWEAPGAGSCPQTASATASGGCLYLISSGQSTEASYFADADREGRNAYFFTSSQLVPADRDQLYDIYDASEGGGLASQHQVPAVPCGSGQACQGAQRTPEAATSPGTSSFVGPGNPKAKPHKKKHKKKGRKHHKAKNHKGGRK